MTRFEDQLYEQLITEHGHHLRGLPRPAPARRRVRRSVWLATGAAGAVAAATVTAVVLGSAPALAAYSVTRHDNAITVAVNRASGVAGANVTLHAMGTRVRVVPVRPGCPSIASLPRPQSAPHLAVSVKTGVNGNGHRSVTVKVGQERHPRRGHDDPGRRSAVAGAVALRWGPGASSPGPCPAG